MYSAKNYSSSSNFMRVLVPITSAPALSISLTVAASEIDGEMREGLVFRSRDGKLSFKAVSNKFLEKYHG